MNRLTTAHRLALTASLFMHSLTADAGPKFTLDVNPWAVGGPSCRWWSSKLRTVACIVEEDGADGPRRGIRFVNETESKTEWLPKPDSPDAEAALRRVNAYLRTGKFMPVFEVLDDAEKILSFKNNGGVLTVSLDGQVVATLRTDPECTRCYQVSYLPTRYPSGEDLVPPWRSGKIEGVVIATYRENNEEKRFPFSEREWDKITWDDGWFGAYSDASNLRVLDIRVVSLPRRLKLEGGDTEGPPFVGRARLDSGFPLAQLGVSCLWTAGTSVLCMMGVPSVYTGDYGLAVVNLRTKEITKFSWLANWVPAPGCDCDEFHLALDRPGLAAWNKAISKFRPAPIYWEVELGPQDSSVVVAPGVTVERKEKVVLVKAGQVSKRLRVGSTEEAFVSFTGTGDGYLLVVGCPGPNPGSRLPLVGCPWEVLRMH